LLSASMTCFAKSSGPRRSAWHCGRCAHQLPSADADLRLVRDGIEHELSLDGLLGVARGSRRSSSSVRPSCSRNVSRVRPAGSSLWCSRSCF
jgi:hypothetical protein